MLVESGMNALGKVSFEIKLVVKRTPSKLGNPISFNFPSSSLAAFSTGSFANYGIFNYETLLLYALHLDEKSPQ